MCSFERIFIHAGTGAALGEHCQYSTLQSTSVILYYKCLLIVCRAYQQLQLLQKSILLADQAEHFCSVHVWQRLSNRLVQASVLCKQDTCPTVWIEFNSSLSVMHQLHTSIPTGTTSALEDLGGGGV